jgi:signal transduction histidine kinase
VSSQRAPSTFAKVRIERVIGRVFSLAATGMSLVQIFLVAIPHQKFGDSRFLIVSLALILAAQLSAVFTFWFGSANTKVYLLHGAAYVLAFIAYPFSVTSETVFPDDYRSWLWWWTGTATIAMTMYLPKWWSFAYLGFVPLSYFFLRLQPAGGAEDIGSATLDATYILLYALAVQSLVTLLRVAAIELDAKNDEFAASALRQAEKDATEFESQKLDELVHDQVLTTILLAAKADTPDRKIMATESATAAIERLQSAASDEVSELQEISVGSFIDSLQESLRRGYPNALISVTKDRDFTMPISVGIALADATIQAMTNSMQHAGHRAIRQVHLKADRHGLKIVVKDDGKGFWESKIPKNRLGIRNSIRRRANMVGADVRIESQPRKGATVVLKWSPNA